MLNLRTMYRLRRLINVMLPVLATQLAIIGMNFFDATMSGHAGTEQLAGSSIGGSLMMPIIASSTGILMAATPIIAHLIGKNEKDGIATVIHSGLILSIIIELILLLAYFFFIDDILAILTLEPDVYYIAKYYMLALIIGLSGGLLTFPLRSLTDTVAGTAVSMKIYLLALPINAFIIINNPQFKNLALFNFKFSLKSIKEYLGIGIPNGMGIFMEASLFGFIIIFISKFGTNYIAAHQAAMSFSSVLYMLPLSFSLALTIIIGIEVGAKRYLEAKKYAYLGLIVSFLCVLSIVGLVFYFRDYIALLYATDTTLLTYIAHFLIYTAAWQLFDAIACPIQGILRGYKDVKAAFYVSMLAYWGICLPLGMFLDYFMTQGAFAYWQSMVLGVATSAVLLFFRLRYIEKRFI